MVTVDAFALIVLFAIVRDSRNADLAVVVKVGEHSFFSVGEGIFFGFLILDEAC